MYILFALISTVLNLTFQYLTSLIYKGTLNLYVSMFVGTFVGLVSKYLLDKKFIFHVVSKNKKNNVNTFLLYTITGIITTLLFWGIEIGFNYVFGGKTAKYFGAIIGLSVGYFIKFRLDKKYVFN